jgi:microcystin degradation protein MlrC
MAPHEDAIESKQRALENLLTRIENGKGKPLFKAWVPVPILLPGEQTSTRINPGKKLYSQVEPTSKIKGVLDAAIWIGYAWADEPRNHAVVVVTGDNEKNVKKIINKKSDKEIYNYLIERYGDWILFNPPLKINTFLLWGFPLMFALLGGVFIYIKVVVPHSRQ